MLGLYGGHVALAEKALRRCTELFPDRRRELIERSLRAARMDELREDEGLDHDVELQSFYGCS